MSGAGTFERGLKSVHLSLTERQLSRGSRGDAEVDLHNYTVMIYDDSPDVSPERRKFLARAPRYRRRWLRAYFAKRYQEPGRAGRSRHCASSDRFKFSP